MKYHFGVNFLKKKNRETLCNVANFHFVISCIVTIRDKFSKSFILQGYCREKKFGLKNFSENEVLNYFIFWENLVIKKGEVTYTFFCFDLYKFQYSDFWFHYNYFVGIDNFVSYVHFVYGVECHMFPAQYDQSKLPNLPTSN